MRIACAMASAVLLATTLCAQGRNLAGLATASARYPFVIGVDRPGRLIADLHAAIDGYRDDPHRVAVLAELDAELQKEFSVSVFDPRRFVLTGIDAVRPMRLALFDFGGWLGLPQSALLEFGIADRAKFLAWFQSCCGDAQKIEASEPSVYVFDKQKTALTMIGRTCSLCIAGGKLSAQSYLSDALAAKGRTMTIGAHPGYLRGAEYLANDPSAHVALYMHGNDPVSGKKLFEGSPIEAILLALGRRAAFLSIVPKADFPVLEHIRSGAKCAEFLGLLPKPIASCTISVADPMGLLRAVVEDGFRSELSDYDEGLKMIDQFFGLSERELKGQLRDGSIALLVYPGSRGHEPRFLCSLHLRDPKSMRAKITKLVQAGRFQFEVEVDDADHLVVWDDGEKIFLALKGEYLLVGTAHAEVLAMTKGEVKAWTPQVGNGEIVEIDVGLVDLFRFAEARLSDRMAGELAAAGRFYCTGKRVKDGFVVEVGFRSKTGRGLLGEFAHLTLFHAGEDWGERSLKRQLAECEEQLADFAGRATVFWKTHAKLPPTSTVADPARDPWGTVWRLQIAPGGGKVVAQSAGTDGRFGTDDDLSSH